MIRHESFNGPRYKPWIKGEVIIVDAARQVYKRRGVQPLDGNSLITLFSNHPLQSTPLHNHHAVHAAQPLVSRRTVGSPCL
jgi:hypothetical protein